MNIEKENKQLKESAKLAADASFKLSEMVYNLKAENERLKQQLAEIKAIAEKGLDKYHNGLILAEQILNLINEIEVE